VLAPLHPAVHGLVPFDFVSGPFWDSMYGPVIRWGLRVIEYKANYLAIDGHFSGYEPLICADDEAAIDTAKKLVNQYGIEIWSGTRLVMCLVARFDQFART
jgi:hypothetical protein